jgi:hypothetical protein
MVLVNCDAVVMQAPEAVMMIAAGIVQNELCGLGSKKMDERISVDCPSHMPKQNTTQIYIDTTPRWIARADTVSFILKMLTSQKKFSMIRIKRTC